MRENRWITPLILVALVTLFAWSFLAAPSPQEGEEAFGGTDAAVTAHLEEQGHTPWFSPLFEPGSGEIESGLFALQAALGAGVLGYALGNLRGRRAARTQTSSAAGTAGTARTAGAAGPKPGPEVDA